MTPKNIGILLKKKRTSLNITQKRLSDITSISVHAIINIEKGEGNPTIEILNTLCDVLGLELVIHVKGEI